MLKAVLDACPRDREGEKTFVPLQREDLLCTPECPSHVAHPLPVPRFALGKSHPLSCCRHLILRVALWDWRGVDSLSAIMLPLSSIRHRTQCGLIRAVVTKTRYLVPTPLVSLGMSGHQSNHDNYRWHIFILSQEPCNRIWRFYWTSCTFVLKARDHVQVTVIPAFLVKAFYFWDWF